MSIETTRVSHTEHVLAARTDAMKDLTPDQRERLMFRQDLETAQANLERAYPDGDHNRELAAQLTLMLTIERSRREAHFYRYRLMTRSALMGPLLGSGESFPEISLLDIEERTSMMTDEDWKHAATYTGKGISAELGHVDQLGDWDAGHDLDDAVRRLPYSPRLAEAGFVFGDTYDKKDAARISYEFYITDGGLKAKRKRAAADVLTESETIYNLVKSSTYLVDVRELGQKDVRMIRSVQRAFMDGKKLSPQQAQERDQVFEEAGRAIIEPFVSEKDRREHSTAVLAVTSLYFALVRHR